VSNLAWQYGAAPGLRGSDFLQLTGSADPVEAMRRLADANVAAARSCAILNIWYIPGRALRAVYLLDDVTVVTVQFFRQGASGEAYRAALAVASSPARVRHLPDWDAVAWRFPEDPGLPALSDLLERTAALAGASGQAGTWRLLSYLPGERCAIRAQAGPGAPAVVGKLQRGPGAAASHERIRQLWDAPGRTFRIPRPLAADVAMGARWESFVAGRRLEDAIRVEAPGPLLASVAGALAALHLVAIGGLPAQGPPAILRRIERKTLTRVRIALPRLASPAEALFAELVAVAATLPARAPVTIHGDLHTANVIIDAGAPTFIDLDSLAAGDAAYDLALLGSRLILSALRVGGRAEAAIEAARELPALYVRAGGEPVPAPVYAWYLAALLLGRQLKTCLRNAAPQTEALAPILIDLARATLAGGALPAA
jgi:hypothetical protein